MEAQIVKLPEEVKVLADKVPAKKQQEVMAVLNQIFSGTQEWEKQIDGIVVKDISDKMSIQLADVARKNVKNARLTAEKVFDQKRAIVQQAKAEWDLEDKLWLKAKQIMQITLKALEDKAEFKAKTVERYELQLKEARTARRKESVEKLFLGVPESNYSEMSDETFNLYISGLKNQYEEREKARKQEEDAQKKRDEEDARLRKENEELRKQKEEAEKKAEEAEKERLRMEAVEKGRAMIEEEARVRTEAMAAIDRELPDKVKLLALAKKLEVMSVELFGCTSDDGKRVEAGVQKLLMKISDWIIKETGNM